MHELPSLPIFLSSVIFYVSYSYVLRISSIYVYACVSICVCVYVYVYAVVVMPSYECSHQI